MSYNTLHMHEMTNSKKTKANTELKPKALASIISYYILYHIYIVHYKSYVSLYTVYIYIYIYVCIVYLVNV